MPVRLRGLSLLARFSLLSLLAVLALGTALATVLERRVRERALAGAETSAHTIVAGTVLDAFVPNDWPGLSEERRREVDGEIEVKHLHSAGVRAVKVFNAGTQLIWSSDGRGVGRTAGASADVAAALRGDVRSERTRGTGEDGRGADLLEVHVPIRDAPGLPPVGVAEVSLDDGEAVAALRADVRDLYLLVAVGLGLLWVALFRVVAQASRRLRRSAADMRAQARHDALTGLSNRTALQERGSAALAELLPGEVAGLLLIDLDHFKEVNDTLGHDHGDRLLAEVAQRLRPLARHRDVLARLGGDEFAILATGAPDVAALRARAEGVRAALAEPVDLVTLAVRVDASVGIAVAGDHGNDIEALLKHADVAMYDAKATSDRVRVYDPALDPYTEERLVLATELPDAIARGELVVHYQPIVGAHGTGVTGVEALVRWQHPTRGLLAPSEFLSLAESTGAIGPLTRSVIEQAVRQGHAWQRAGHDLEVAVNLASASATDASLPGVVAAALERWPLPPGRLTLELSEDTVITDPRRVAHVLDRLSALGVRLSLDDFGTGQSSLAYLRKLPLDELKIDRSFVMTLDHHDTGVVDAMIALARRPSVPPGLLARLAGDDSETVRRAVLERNDLPEEAVLALAQAPEQDIRLHVASAEGLSGAVLDLLLADPDTTVRTLLAVRPDLGPGRLARLAADPDAEVRRAVAYAEAPGQDALTTLSVDPNAGVRRAAARHPGLPADLLPALAADPDEGVRLAVAGRDDLPEELRLKLIHDADESVRAEAGGEQEST